MNKLLLFVFLLVSFSAHGFVKQIETVIEPTPERQAFEKMSPAEQVAYLEKLHKKLKKEQPEAIREPLYGDKPIIISTDNLEDPEQMCENCAKKDAHPLEYLRLYLKGLKFHKIYKEFFANYYGVNTLNECFFKTSPFHPNTTEKRLRGVYDNLKRSVIKFWILGMPLSKKEQKKFFGKNKKLLAQLFKLGIVRVNFNKQLVLNSLTLSSVPLIGKKALLLFSDLPSCHGGPEKGGARLSTTSLVTLKHLLHEYKKDKVRFENYKTIADFGSGVGVLGLAALKIAPKIKKAIGLEVNRKAMLLSLYNAILNQMGNRLKVIYNIPTSNLTKALKGQELDFAVANPPYNTFPQKFKKQFPTFGYGGSNGLAITSIFIDQVNQHLKDNGRFIFYSQLAETTNMASGKSITILEMKINNNRRYKFKTEIMKHNWGTFTTKQYAFGLSYFLQKAYPCKAKLRPKALEKELSKQAIMSFNHYYVTMIKNNKLARGEVTNTKPARFPKLRAHFNSEIEDDYTASTENDSSGNIFGGRLDLNLDTCKYKKLLELKINKNKE